MNWTSCGSQDFGASRVSQDHVTKVLCMESITTWKPENGSTGLSSFGTATTAVLGSMGIVALILLLVGLLSMMLKKWKHKITPGDHH